MKDIPAEIWEWDQPDKWHGLSARVFRRADDGRFEPIAQVQLTGWPRKIGLIHASVIAAAPEMYEALRSIENDDGRIPPAIWKMRNDAIAKAEGGSK